MSKTIVQLLPLEISTTQSIPLGELITLEDNPDSAGMALIKYYEGDEIFTYESDLQYGQVLKNWRGAITQAMHYMRTGSVE